MRKVMYPMTVSLDGFVEAADGQIDWGSPDAELHQHFNDREREIDVHLYGRRLYELMSAYWPTADQNPEEPTAQTAEYARIWMEKPKVVFSTTLKQVGWNSRLAVGNLAEEINRLKAEPGKYMSVGGPGLAGSLMRLGLIDEYWLYVRPILLGGGKRMFPPLEDRIQLRLLETRTFGGGVVMMRYGRDIESGK